MNEQFAVGGNPPKAEVDVLAPFREQVRAESDTKPKMSDKTAARLREINEHDRAEKIANTRFAEWFGKQNVTVEFLMDLMFRIASGDAENIRKRAVKCAHMFQRRRHTTLSEPHDIMFLAELLPEESEMSLAKIESRYPVDYNQPIFVPKVEEKPVRRCALGRKCLRAKNNRAAEVAGKAEYCSDNCRGRAKMLARLTQKAAA
jgi:hypothetical protein